MALSSSIDGTPPGIIKYFAGANAPGGYLKANGSAVSRTTYAALFLVIGTTYGVGDGTTTFNVPELRGEFIRSLDDGRAVDAGRTIGSAQAADISPHNHSQYIYNSGGSVGGTGTMGAATANNAAVGATGMSGLTETRPRNVALLACIKT